jgi:hypothetical protein
MNAPEPQDAAREAIRHWPRLTELARFAVERVSFGDSDGGFGIDYPDFLDDRDGRDIPAGCVDVYGFWGPPEGDSVMMPESAYLTVLSRVLEEAGHNAEAELVNTLIKRLPSE